MVVVTAKGKYKKFYCSGHRSYNACDVYGKGTNVEEIEEIVRIQIFDRINDISNTICNYKETDTMWMNAIKIKLITVEKQIDHIINQICISGEALTNLLNSKVETLIAEKEYLQKELEKEISETKMTNYGDLKKCMEDWKNSTVEQKKILASSMIKQITVKNTEINIEWKV